MLFLRKSMKREVMAAMAAGDNRANWRKVVRET